MNGLVCDAIRVDLDSVGILRDVSFKIEFGSIAGLIGPNGSGKTTLLNVISGLQKPSKGTVTLGDRVLNEQPRHNLRQLGIFRSFQEGRLFDSLTALENVAAASDSQPDESLMAALVPFFERDPHQNERSLVVAGALDETQLQAETSRPAAQMSYGMRKRTVMAQVHVANSILCLLDEPLAGIDLPTRDKMLSLITKLRNQKRIVLLVEHDLEAVKALTDRVLLLKRGRLIFDGDTNEAFRSQIVGNTYLHNHDG
jgi:ABC-type branched-subunit amino acid transport system ATPase component